MGAGIAACATTKAMARVDAVRLLGSDDADLLATHEMGGPSTEPFSS